MKRNFLILIGSALIAMGCQSSKFLSGQGWSENYALMKNAVATDPRMIDGDHKTGEAAKMFQASAEVIVEIPEVKQISKIKLTSRDLNKGQFKGKKCELFYREPSSDEWKRIESFIVKSFVTEIKFPAVETDAIRFQLPTRTAFKKLVRQEIRPTGDIVSDKIYDYEPPEILEIEIYGPVSTKTN